MGTHYHIITPDFVFDGAVEDCPECGLKAPGGLSRELIQAAMADSANRHPKNQISRALKLYRERGEFDGSYRQAVECLSVAEYDVGPEVLMDAFEGGWTLLGTNGETLETEVAEHFKDHHREGSGNLPDCPYCQV